MRQGLAIDLEVHSENTWTSGEGAESWSPTATWEGNKKTCLLSRGSGRKGWSPTARWKGEKGLTPTWRFREERKPGHLPRVKEAFL
jgi:hypothetical protein